MNSLNKKILRIFSSLNCIFDWTADVDQISLLYVGIPPVFGNLKTSIFSVAIIIELQSKINVANKERMYKRCKEMLGSLRTSTRFKI